MKIAIIGSGVSGLTAAYHLQHDHEITVFEKENRIGGHTATMDVEVNNKQYAIDTGFIVFNDWTYPEFIALMDELGVSAKDTEMSFSVSCSLTGLEYGGSDFNALFAQRRNLFRPRYWGMLRDIVRFNREAIIDLDAGSIPETTTLGEYLAKNNYGQEFIQRYLVPMGCAIWSASTNVMMDFPLVFFIRFFKNHGLLSVNNRPQWRVIEGGSRTYLEPLTRGFRDNIVTGAEINSVKREAGIVKIEMSNDEVAIFDEVIFACHSDQALKLLSDPTPQELEVLRAIPYQSNQVVLHTDTNLLPSARRAWSSWNYLLKEQQQEHAVLTYNMNILQGIDSDITFCVTLNDTEEIDPEKILGQYEYSHPVFSMDSVAMTKKWGEINGVHNSWFAGAYWGNGFHEDGVVSGKRVADSIKHRQQEVGSVVRRYA